MKTALTILLYASTVIAVLAAVVMALVDWYERRLAARELDALYDDRQRRPLPDEEEK